MVDKLKSIRRYLLGNFRLFILRINGSSIKTGSKFFCARHVFITRKHWVKAGNNVFLGRYVHIASNLIIGNDVMIASQVSFVGGDHRIDEIGNTPMKDAGIEGWKTTRIGNNVWIGHGSIILAGINIADGAVVAAGSVVTKDVAENSIVAGNYAKEIRKRKLL